MGQTCGRDFCICFLFGVRQNKNKNKPTCLKDNGQERKTKIKSMAAIWAAERFQPLLKKGCNRCHSPSQYLIFNLCHVFNGIMRLWYCSGILFGAAWHLSHILIFNLLGWPEENVNILLLAFQRRGGGREARGLERYLGGFSSVYLHTPGRSFFLFYDSC